jgi:hypothetical protein
MLLTLGGLVAAGILLTMAWLNESPWLKKFVLGGVVIWFAFYAVMLIGASLMSKERLIAVGDKDGKEFCGFYLDCHMHTAVLDVRKAKSLGSRRAIGEFYVVRVNVFSDARAATLGLLTVEAHVVDAAGRAYARDLIAEEQLAPQPQFEQKVGPNEHFDKEIVFDLPVDVEQPKLDIREGYGIDHVIESVLIDDEDSIFHARNYFDLDVGNAGTLAGKDREAI